VKRRLGHSEESRVVFFYDGYEKQSVRTLAERAPWLRTLIATMHVGIHIIAAQEHLGWSESELRDLIEPIELGKLPDADCRKMIRRELGDLDRKTESRLVEASGSLPFYLRALIDVCRVDIERYGVTRISTLPPSLRAVVDQYLEHLGPPHSTVIPMLAAVQYFDRPLYGHLVHAADLPSDTTRMSDFVEWFFVANLGGGLYKTHDLLTDAARSVQTDTTIPTLRNAAAHLYVRTGEPPAIGADHLPQMFRALIEGWQSTSGMSVDDVEQLIDIGYCLYDAGHWRGLVELPAAFGGDSHPAGIIAGYFAALAARRIDGPARGLDLLAALEPSQTVLGRHVASFEIERAYLREISGDYAYARAEFRRLNGEAVPFDPSRRDHVRARLYHADMLIMDGQFADANELLADAYELVRTRSSLDRPELLRHRGHAYRFSLEFRAAEDLYLRALGEARDSPSMKAKLRTNLAESRCWHDPHTAIDDARAAIDLNTRLSSRIEIAKAHAALGVALANNGEIDQARDACEVAISVSRQVDYPAGICFGLQARVVLEVRSRDPAAADRAYAELLDRLKGLGTYQHLSVVPAWMRGDEVEFQSRTGQIGWISGTSRRSHLDLIAGS
jgi:tetratricopeptide (TPR) repeat protein